MSKQAQANAEEAFKQHIEMMDVTYMSLLDRCKAKCLEHETFADGELNKGQSVCLDRCVSKFFAVFAAVNEQLMERSD